MKIHKTPPYIPFEKKSKFPKGYVLADMGFWNEKKVYEEDWQVVRVDETTKK